MTVYLVGAGPGDPGLITARGAQLLGKAGAVVHDRLVHHSLLELAPAGAEVHDVGKRPGARSDQATINELLVALGRRHEVVVRLKGGDPFVFGRGGEEALALQAAGLSFEVVPGVSAPNGVLAYAGIPLTHRGVSAAFTVVTGHGEDGTAAGAPVPVDWDALARLGGTIVILMGVAHRAEISSRLVAGGMSPETPAAVVESGSLAGQKTIRTTLAGLASANVANPATVVIGEVANLDLSWFKRPLAGWKVAVTRTREQASVLSTALELAGAEPIEIPTIAIHRPADGGKALRAAVDHLSDYDWVIFTSANTVERLWQDIRDARAFGRARIACIGEGTAAVLRSHGVVPDLVPDTFVSEALAAAFPPAKGERVLWPRAARTRDVLLRELRAKGYEVDSVEAYRTARPELPPDVLAAARGADAVVFASASSAVGWIEMVGTTDVPGVAVCIGPVTRAAAQAAGIDVVLEAGERSIAGLVTALVDYAAAQPVVPPSGAVRD